MSDCRNHFGYAQTIGSPDMAFPRMNSLSFRLPAADQAAGAVAIRHKVHTLKEPKALLQLG
jgi:hypothetical protein